MRPIKLTRNGPLILITCVWILSLWGCGPGAGTFKISPTNVSIEVVGSKTYPIADRGTIEVTEYQLPKALKVDTVDYDDSLNSVLVKYSRGEEEEGGGYLLYDLEKRNVSWTATSDMSFVLMREDDLLLKDGKGPKLFNAVSANFVRDAENYLYLLSGGKTLFLSPDTFARIDVKSGRRIWSQPGHASVGYPERYPHGEWVYVVAEGLHALNVENGKKWQYLTPTSWKNVGKAVATSAAVACLSLGTVVPAYNPDVTMNMNSEPLLADNKVFFAARDKLVCLEKMTGKLVWQIEIDPELEGMGLSNVSETEIALVGTGMKIVNRGLKQSDPPTIRTIRKEDGKITALFTLEKNSIVQNFTRTKERYLLVTPDQLLVFNKDLKPTSILEAKREYGNFIGILTAGDTMVVRTSKGIVALSLDSFKEVWFQYCEVSDLGESDEWIKPFREKNRIKGHSFFQYGLYWTLNEKDGLTAYDLSAGKEVSKLELGGKHSVHFGGRSVFDSVENTIKSVGRCIVDFDGSKITFVSFK